MSAEPQSSTTESLAAKVRSFQQRTLCTSITDILIFDRLADYLLECCHAQAKPNTLSLFSFLSLLIAACIIGGPSRWAFFLAILSILLHQVMDIANKKQAYRLNQFSLGSYFVDHMFDAFSAVCIAQIVGTLFQFTPQYKLMAIYLFAMLPFYLHHLVVYNGGYLTFPLISPSSQGLLLLQIVFFLGLISPSIITDSIVGDINLCSIVCGVLVIWLVVFIVIDIKALLTSRSTVIGESMPLKNLFVIIVLGYLMFQCTLIQSSLLHYSAYYLFVLSLFTFCFVSLTNSLILAFGYNTMFNQISLHFLFIGGLIASLYTFMGFAREEEANELGTIGKAVTGVIGAISILQLGWFVRNNWRTVQQVDKCLQQ